MGNGRETSTAHVLFMDIAGFTKLKNDKQREIFEALNEIASDCIKSYSIDSRLIIPTGDGMAIAFLKNPEAPLKTALKLSPILKNSGIPVRMGMHIGPIFLVEDINKQRNIVGGGINMAQRVMDSGDEWHILASSAYAKYMKEINEEYDSLFKDIGEFEIKHGKTIWLFNVYDDSIGNPLTPEKKAKKKARSTLEPRRHYQPSREHDFVGRKDMLDVITEWYDLSKVNIGAIVGWGGVGKSTIARRWYDELGGRGINPDGIFWWGFYKNTDITMFVDSLYEYLGGDPNKAKTIWEKVDRIKELLQQGEYLIVLDGLEVMQKDEHRGADFGCMEQREFTDLLTDIVDSDTDGLCLITSRYPIKDIERLRKYSYSMFSVEAMEKQDAVALLKKRNVHGPEEEFEKVVNNFKGHALSLASVAGYLNRYYEGDISKAPDISFVCSDDKRWEDVNKLLNKYIEKMDESEAVFLKIFSLFRTEVEEKDFIGVFRKTIVDTSFNESLVKMNDLDFVDLLKGLLDWFLLSYDENRKTYSTHPLIKKYFESVLEEESKALCHRAIYEFNKKDAPEEPMTLKEMGPLFEAVYHGCQAGMYDEAFDDVYVSRIKRKNKAYLTIKLGAWETDLNLVRNFFPKGNLSELPRVTNRSFQSYLLNEAALALLSTGRPDEATEIFLRTTEMYIEDKNWGYASVCRRNLADLEFRSGRVKDAIASSRKALELAEKMDGSKKKKEEIKDSKAYLAYTLFLSGDDDKAGKLFKEAKALEIELTPQVKGLYCQRGVRYADYLMTSGNHPLALETSERNLELMIQHNYYNDISRCHRSLGAIKRVMATKESIDEASGHLKTALDIARKAGMPALEMEALIERARLRLDANDLDGAFTDLELVLKMVERTTFMLHKPDALVTLAKVRSAQGESEEAKRLANSAISLAEDMPYVWPIKEAREFLGQ